MINKVNSFLDLAKIFNIPENEINKVKESRDREYSRQTYFAHKNLYDKHVAKQLARQKAKEVKESASAES